MRKILCLVLVVLLVIGSFTSVYGFDEWYVSMKDELNSIVDTEIPYYDNILTDLSNQYDDLNMSYDIISGTIVSYNPFTVYLDTLKGVTGGFGSTGGFPISTEYAEISLPDYNCIKDGYYEAPHPYNSTFYSETYSKNVRTYGESSKDVKKAYELEKSIKYIAAQYSKAQLGQKGYVTKVIGDKGQYTGQVDELGVPNGRGSFYKGSYSGWTLEGNFLHGLKNGFCRDGNNYSIYYKDICIETEDSEVATNVFLKLYVGTPAVKYSKLYFNGYGIPTMNNFNKGMTMNIDNIIYFPMREVVEHFDNYVTWDAVKGTMVNEVISVTTDSNIINVRGSDVTLSGNVKVIDGVTYVPIDFITKAFDVNCYSYEIDSTSYATPVVKIVQNIAG